MNAAATALAPAASIPLLWCPVLHQAALTADAAWSAALVRRFRSRAGDMRYLPEGKGEPGSELRRIHDARMDAMQAWHRSIAEHRQAREGCDK